MSVLAVSHCARTGTDPEINQGGWLVYISRKRIAPTAEFTAGLVL